MSRKPSVAVATRVCNFVYVIWESTVDSDDAKPVSVAKIRVPTCVGNQPAGSHFCNRATMSELSAMPESMDGACVLVPDPTMGMIGPLEVETVPVAPSANAPGMLLLPNTPAEQTV